MTRYLVTGATGGLGRNAVQALIAAGHTVRATGRDRLAGRLLALEGAEFVQLDLCWAGVGALASLMVDVDVVWHCAALAAPWGNRHAFIAANATATADLLAAATHAGVGRFIHVSSPIVYFDFQHRYLVHEGQRANTPVNAYAESKLLAEEAVQRVGSDGPMRCVILRPRAIFGPYDRVLLPRLLRMHRACHGTLFLPRGGDTILDVTYVENVVLAMLLASRAKLPAGVPVYNVTNDEPLQFNVVLRHLFGAMGKRCRVVAVPVPAILGVARASEKLGAWRRREPTLTTYGVGALAYDMTLDIGRARRELYYRPQFRLDEAVRRTAAWMRDTRG